MADWTQCRWGDIAKLAYGRGLAGYQTHAPSPIRVFGTNGPIGYTSNALASGPGVIVGRKGAYRGIHYSPGDYYVIDTAFYVVPTQEIDLRWAYYELLTHDINGLDSGSAIPSTSRESFYSLEVALPTLQEQRAIADVLGSLDDKINSNRRLKACLAQKSYWTLLSEVGQVLQPAVGASGTIRGLSLNGDDLRIVNTGLQNDSEARSFTYLATADVFDNEYRIGEQGTKEVLPSRANMEPGSDRCWFARMKATSKWLWTPTDFGDEWDSIILSTGFLGVESSDSRLAPIVMTAIRSPEFQDAKNQLCNGTTMQSLNNDSAGQLVIRVPSDGASLTMLAKDLRLNLLLEHQLNNQNMRLIGLRDALLPELLSGRLRVKDAESMMENV